MANSDRLFKNDSGDIFIPMNLEGDAAKENFISPFKLVCIVSIILSFIYIIGYLASINGKLLGWIVYLLIWFSISQAVLRKVVFEEKYYLANFREMFKNKKSTPALFWAIASFEDTESGCIMNYMDGKIGVVIKLERDTIVGKPRDFEEQHYDGISDFYMELNLLNYRYVHANVMEEAGKDVRLSELDKLVYQDDNKNVQKLMEYMVGHTKKITRRALYETDYVLVYTKEKNKIDSIADEVEGCASSLLNGAFSGFTILTSEDLTDLIKEENGVKYFNPTEATLKMFEREGSKIAKPFNIVEVHFENGTSIDIDKSNEHVMDDIQNKLANSIELESSIESSLKAVSSIREKEKKKTMDSIISNLDDGLLASINNSLYADDEKESEKEKEFAFDEEYEDDEIIDF